MEKFLYLAILAACVLGTLPLEFVLKVRVYARWRRLLVALVPVIVIFSIWDVLAIADGWWHFDPERVTGVRLPFSLPLEELLFFVVVPICSVLTFEAVRQTKPAWAYGDELGGDER